MQKMELVNEKLAKVQANLANSKMNLKEQKEKEEKLLIVAQKYGVDVTRIKEYIQGGPDPEKAVISKKLAKATELASIEK